MAAKPDHLLEDLATRLIDTAQAQRVALVAELAARAAAGDAGSPKAGAGAASGGEAPVLALVRTGKFLSARLATAVGAATGGGAAEAVIARLESLHCAGEVRETARVLCAYFLKYRFLDLSELSRPRPDAGATGSPVTRHWRLPDDTGASLVETGSPPRLSPGSIASMLPSRVTAVPWLGHLKPADILPATGWLTEVGLLEFAYDTEVRANGAPAGQGVPVLRLNPSFEPADPDVRDAFARARREAREAEAGRRRLVEDLGTGLRAVGGYETYRLIADASPNDVVKISTYHLRTVVGERSLVDWLRDKRTLRVQIMCLGPTSVDALTEGADPVSLVSSLVRGVQGFRRVRGELPPGQVEIRVYGDREAKSLFRGAIQCDARDRPKRAVVTIWPYGRSRGNYGNILRLQGDSNLAHLLVRYFDDAWEDSVPLPFFRRLEILRWTLRSASFEMLTAMIIVVVAGLILVGRPSWGGDAFFALVAVVPVLALGLVRIGQRAGRALTLSLAVLRRDRSAGPG